MTFYADSSFIVSCYITDANTVRAKTFLLSNNVPLPFTVLHRLEAQNAMNLGVFRGLFSPADATAAIADLNQDIRSGRLVKTIVNWPVAFRIASHLSDRHSQSLGVRSLDVLHIAAARSLRAADFLSFDQRQRNLASAIAMRVRP